VVLSIHILEVRGMRRAFVVTLCAIMMIVSAVTPAVFSGGDNATQIQAADEPHIFDIDMWDMNNPAPPLGPGPSVLNTVVGVGSTYTFFVEANYTIGGVDLWASAPVNLELAAWFDGGIVGSASTPPDPSWSSGTTRDQQFWLTYYGGIEIAMMNYPIGPPNEFSLHSWWEDPNVYAGSAHRVFINVTFSDAVEADGNGFVNGGATLGQIWDKNSALNDPNSWDFTLEAYDSVQPTAKNYSYEEFGVGNVTDPDIWISPSTFDFTVEVDQSDSDTLIIGNNGGAPLNYTISLGGGSTPWFDNDFDNETEGTSPPNGFIIDSALPIQECEVDDVQSHSSPHGMYLVRTGGFANWGYARFLETFTDDTFKAWLYLDTVNDYRVIRFEDDTDDAEASSLVSLVFLDSGGDINYYDGTMLLDSGYNYTVGWHEFEITHNFTAKTYQIHYDGTKITPATDPGFYKPAATAVKSVHFGCSNAVGTSQMWVDDISISTGASGPGWLSVSPLSGSLQPANSAPHSVDVDATGLPIGFYQANITIESNDPDENPLMVPVSLTVTKVMTNPVMELTKWAPATAGQGDVITYWLNYSNVGNATAYNVWITEFYPTDVIFISSLPLPTVGDNTWYMGDVSQGASGSIQITVQVSPAASGSLVNYVELEYDNATGPQPIVNATAVTDVVIMEPDIWVNPTHFDFVLPPDQTDSDILTIGNSGSMTLYYNISVPVVTIDPVAHWKLDETSGTTAYDSAGFHNGTVSGGTLMGQPGADGTCYWFDGTNDRVSVGHDDDIDFSPGEDFSIYAWINTTYPDYGRIIEKRLYPGNTRGYTLIVWNNGTVRASLGDGTAGTSVYSHNVLTDGLWHHIGMVKQGNSLELFVDGVSQGVNNTVIGDFSNTDTLFIGTDCGEYWDYHGYIDDVRIYDQAVSPSQLAGTAPNLGFVDDFDSEAEGTSPPSNWVTDGGYPPTYCEVDDVHSHSGSHSMWLRRESSSVGICRYDIPAGVTDGKFTMWVYFSSTTTRKHIRTLNACGDHSPSNVAALVQLRNDGSIWWYDGSYHSTGYSYTTSWHKFEFVHDCPNNQFDMWFDGTMIIDNGNFCNPASSVKSLHFQVDTTFGNCEMWIDDVSIEGLVQQTSSFEDNFDTEALGTSPPVNWVPDTTTNFIPLSCEVDDTHSRSAPHSMFLESPSTWYGFCHHDIPGGITDEPYSFSVYPPTSTIMLFMNTQNNVGNFDVNAIAVRLALWDDGTIRHFYSGSFNPTGYNYVGNSWNDFQVIHDCTNSTFDCWHNGALIIDDGAFDNPAADIKSLHFGACSVGSPDYVWIDDVKVESYNVSGGADWLTVFPMSGSVLSGQTVNLTVTVNSTGLAPGFYQSNITIASNDPDENPIVVPVNLTVISTQPQPEMEISKWAPATANAGQTIIYWLNYTNIGNATAHNVFITETYPADVTFVSSIPPPTAGDNIWYLGMVPPGAGGSIQITVSVNPSASGILTNNVELTYENSTGNAMPPVYDTANTTIGPGAYIEILKNAPVTANPGEIIMYTITYMNIGVDTAYNVIITETYPLGVSFVNSNPLPSVGDNIWTIGNLLPGAGGVIYINVSVDGTVYGILTNWVEAVYENSMGVQYSPVFAMANTMVINPEMEVFKWGPATANPGEIITYWINYTNIGNDTAYNAWINDTLPSGVVFVNAIPAPTVFIPPLLAWFIGTVPPGASGSIQIIVQVNAGATGTLVNWVDLNYENGAGIAQPTVSDSATTLIINPLLEVTKWGPPTANPGDYIPYWINYSNIGTDWAYNVIITDIYPPEISFVYAIPPPDVGDNEWFIGALPPGAFGTILIAVQVNVNATPGTVLVNNATVDYEDSIGTPCHDWANAITIVVGPSMDIAKDATPYANETDFITYTISYWNNGTDTAYNVVITETYPPWVTFVSATPPASVGDNVWIISAVPPGGFGTIQITMQIDIGASGVLTNHVDLDYENGAGIPYPTEWAEASTVVSSDTDPPIHSDETPGIDGRTCDPTPEISVHVTDASGVDSSTIHLWVNGFQVFHNLTVIPGGFNVSYWHESGFFDGQIVTVRIVADDTVGNTLDFTWDFTVDLTAPWVVWTDPFDGQQNVPLDYGISVGFSEPMNPFWTELAFEISPFAPGDFSWDNVTETMTFDPWSDLDMNTTYFVNITTLARDIAGNMLASIYSWSFTTVIGDLIPPEHSDESPPVDGYTMLLDPTISVHVTDVSGVNTSSIKLYVQGFQVFHSISAVPNGYNVSYWHMTGFSPGDVVICRIIARDNLGNVLDFTWQFTVAHSYSIDLIPGWNLISFPLSPLNHSVEPLFASIAGIWDMVQHYNNSDPSDPWKSYATFKPPQLNDLQFLYRHHGFWLHVTNATTLIIYGMPVSYTEITLLTGWNMVGYPSYVPTSVADALLGTGYDAVEGFDPGMPYNTVVLNDTYMMKPGEGYWVHVNADVMWVINW
jgi:uncharacterized repeat protein (TIGR01451 family)